MSAPGVAKSGPKATGRSVGVAGLTEDNLRAFNAEQRTYETHKKGKMDDVIDKQVTDFLNTLDKRAKAQLSKTQLIKSVQKVYKWKKNTRMSAAASSAGTGAQSSSDSSGPSAGPKKSSASSLTKAIPKEYLEMDLDSGLYKEKEWKQILAQNPPTGPTQTSAPGAVPGGVPQNNGASPQPRQEPYLDGAHYEATLASKIPPRDAAKRHLQMKDWLARRSLYQAERDRIRKWINTIGKKEEDTTLEELLKVYQRRRRELSLQQLHDILNMKDSKDLSVNELLLEYRRDVAPAPRQLGDSSDDDDDDDDDDDLVGPTRPAPGGTTGVTTRGASAHGPSRTASLLARGNSAAQTQVPATLGKSSSQSKIKPL